MSPEDVNEVTFSDLMPSNKNDDLKEGTHVGRYQILGLIGKGGMGAVYKAYDPELDRSIAIKILTVKPHEGETASRPQARLMREAQALAKLSHPNVVSIFDVGTYEDSVYIAMEYVKCKTLREWIKTTEPKQKEIIKVLSKAGRGLLAAHTEGIVHRDFKPENVIIGDKGQIKVLDFGLARAAGGDEHASSHKEPEAPQEPSSGERLLSTPLTQFGVAIGTTAYMAPEHFEFQELDEKTDQFSFCVTLFEALYGKRPFPGKTVEELEENITSGWIEIPQEANVPKWIEGILLKGLSVSKTERFQNMTALLEALGHDPEITKIARRKKLKVAFVITLLTLLTLGFGYYSIFKSSKVCTGAEKKIAVIWNEEIKAKIRQSFAKTGLSYAKDSFFRVERLFGEYLSKWATLYTETCKATRLRGEQSEEIMDLKMGFLNKHLVDAGALMKVFGEADKTVVDKAVQAVSSLSGFSNCNDVEALQSRIPPPKDEQTKNKVAALRKKLADVEALSTTGKYREGLALAKKLADDAIALDYRAIQAEVLYQLGELFHRTGEYKKAETTLYNAAKTAGQSRDDLLAAKAMVLLVRVVGYEQARKDAGLSFAFDAGIMLDVAGGDLRIRGKLLSNMAAVLDLDGEHEKALDYYRKAIAIQEKALGPQHPDLAASLNNTGVVFDIQGENEKAMEYYHRALSIWEKALGPDHPYVALSLNNIGSLFNGQGESNIAAKYYRKALAIYEKALGNDHPDVARSLYNMGWCFKIKGEYNNAMEYCRKSLSIRKKALGPEHPDVAESLSCIGSVFLYTKMPKKALEPFERAAAICKGKTCYPVSYGFGLLGLAQALVATGGDKERAIKLAKQARDIFGKTPKRFKKEMEEVDAWLRKHDSSNQGSISTAKR